MNNDWIDILESPIDTAKALAFLHDPAAGGIDLFLGTTRAETKTDGTALLGLHYEAYLEMATKQLHDLHQQAKTRWPIQRCVILHRIGMVKVSEPSVLIGVSTPHRKEAFEACKFLIDELKSIATIWKQEHWQTGTTSWVEPR